MHELSTFARAVRQIAPRSMVVLERLHELQEPGVQLRALARARPDLIVVRLPLGATGVVIDVRHRPCDVHVNLEDHGYQLELQVLTSDDWCGFFTRAA